MSTTFARLDARTYQLPPELTERLFSPALVVYLDRVRDNVRTVLAHLEGRPDRWRPHVKTTKIPAVWAELARAGADGEGARGAGGGERRVRRHARAARRESDRDVRTRARGGYPGPPRARSDPSGRGRWGRRAG